MDRDDEKRLYKRYDKELNISFDFVYDIEAKVKFAVINPGGQSLIPKKYSALSRNISVAGLSFVSHKDLRIGDLLYLEVYLPGARNSIPMKGEVEWSHRAALSEQPSGPVVAKTLFETGVKVLFVDGQSVPETIHHDQAYDVDWSIVLASVFDNYKLLIAGKYRSQFKQ
jgi:hypothetical protein